MEGFEKNSGDSVADREHLVPRLKHVSNLSATHSTRKLSVLIFWIFFPLEKIGKAEKPAINFVLTVPSI